MARTHSGSESCLRTQTPDPAASFSSAAPPPPPPAEQPRRTTVTRDARVTDRPSAGVAFLVLVLPSGNRHPDRPTR